MNSLVLANEKQFPPELPWLFESIFDGNNIYQYTDVRESFTLSFFIAVHSRKATDCANMFFEEYENRNLK